jgi:phage FluMu protein Com
MTDVRCKYCSRLLMKLQWGKGEVKCGRCSRIVKFNVTTQSLQKLLDRLEERSKQIAKP